ncbi:MAG: 50S ribosomal protein L35 [Sulfuricurvum sp.]
MPKMKSVKGAVKRFKVKKNGTLKRGTAFRSHILTKQDAGTRRGQKTSKVVAAVDVKNIKKMIVG